MTTSDKIIFYGGGAWGQALAIALSNCNTKSSILVSDKKRMQSLNNGISKCFPDITFPKNLPQNFSFQSPVEISDIFENQLISNLL